MARRRRGNSVKAIRQTRNAKKGEDLNGLSPNLNVVDDSKGVSESESSNYINRGSNCIAEETVISNNGEPVVHHKKFGKIRVSGQSENSIDIDTGKDYSRLDSKSSDENDSESLESSRFTSDSGVMNLVREITAPKVGQNSFADFRKQSSVYKVENDIPLDGSVIIKPGTFSSNTITTSVKSNLFYNPPPNTELSSVNFLKVLQGIEMLERNVSGTTTPLEYGTNKNSEKEYLMNHASSPSSTQEELDGKISFSEFAEMRLDQGKQEIEEELCNDVTMKNIDDLQSENSEKTQNTSPPDDTSSDIQTEAEETAAKLQNIALDDRRETSGSPASKASDDTTDKKAPGARSRAGSTDTAGSESSSGCGATIRRSNRIRSIGIMKQKEREQAAVRAESSLKSPQPQGSPAGTPAVGYDDKPVKVKSRWRRSSELEMHKVVDSESTSPNCTSPVNTPCPTGGGYELTQEDQDRLEKEKKDIEEGLKSFTILTENEYKMERSACKETKRMICDCVLTKEEISRGEVGCGEDCLNRMLFLECGSRCALGDSCTNKRFQKLQYANCKIFKTEKKGFGLRAEEDLTGNTFIMEYVGEVVNQKEFARRVKMYAKENNKHFYFMALKGDSVIDATNKGNISRFINHSCDPNAETQKWTINGELRVGFFTRRFVAAGEEITFDYQFQRYGKQAQKCFCEASNCRGWIGENPESNEDDDEEEEDDYDDEEEDDEEEEEEQEDYKKEVKKLGKVEEDKEKKGEPAKLVQPIRKAKRENRSLHKKKKERKATTIVDDMGLDEEIQKLLQTGLKNRAHTLTLSRLMIRAEDWSTRGKLLKLIREGETPCRRLFLDYHGLRLICSWMLSRELEESSDKNDRRLEILKTLSKLPIPNKNMLLDSKVLSVVEQWSKSSCLIRKLSVDDEAASNCALLTASEPSPASEVLENEKNIKVKQEETIPGLGGEIEEPLKPKEEVPSKEEKGNESSESAEKVKRMAESVLESWSVLKEVFKIPKKERIEQMKEHERQADRGYNEYLDNKENVRDKYDRHDRYGRSDRYRDRDRDRIRDRKRARESPPDPDWFRNHERNSKMTKHERRQLFALKVLQEDEEAKKRNEHLEMWKQHESRCLALGVDPNLNAACDPQTGFPIFFDHNSGTWQNCPPSSGPSPSMPHSVTPTMCASPMYSVNPSMMPNCQMCPNMPLCSCLNNTICQSGMVSNSIPLANGSVCSNVTVPACQSQYPDMTPQYSQPNYEGLDVGFHEAVSSESVQLPYEENAVNDINRPVITEVPLNAPIKLPPKWKAVKDPKGRLYFYHIKERVSQWEPPQWTEEDARIEAAKTVAMEMGEESSSSSESSTDTSSEDADEEGENIETEPENEEKTNSPQVQTTKEEAAIEANSDVGNSNASAEILDDEKDEDLSAWEDEEEVAKSNTKSSKEKVSGSSEIKSGSQAHATTPAKVRRAGLVQEILISPRREEDRVDNRKFKEVKEMLRRQKEEARMKEKLRLKGEKVNVRPSRGKKKRKEKASRSVRLKASSMTTDTSTDRKIKENFKNNMAGAIVSHLNPYRKQDCKIGRITCNEDFKHLARKLTHFVMLKELKHCRGVDDLECNDSVKAKAKDFIKKYMAKFGAVYQRPEHEVWKM